MARVARKIAVLMGGSSFEREFSLESGRYVTRTLEEAGHTVLPLDTTASLVETLRSQRPEVVYIALHGKNGEDGTIQSLLELLDIPFIGSSCDVCRQAWDKSTFGHILSRYRIGASGEGNGTTAAGGGVSGPASWPAHLSLAAVAVKEMGAANALDLVPARIPAGYPVAVKPARGGSAMGISKVVGPDGLAPALLDALSFDTEALVEQWIDGVEVAACVVGCGDDARVLPPVEICPKQGFFDTAHRLDADLVDYYSPVRADSLAADPESAASARALIEAAALEVHRAHGCRDLSRVDLVWDGVRPYVLEVNVSPGMTERSLFPIACRAAGIPFGDLLEELIEIALAR
ncbi:MAG: D-alanine--D-alanine ligase [Coriobacteriales bacterium]|jgi:D-alanine-D-alanine ligase|nr:D-alanine--D-alanine ligase [Coriobacteriales bacterium]